MREIKFRAWDKTMGCYATDPFHMFIDFNGCVSNFQNGSGGAEYDLEQFTGLYDKNGKEIYEGDILRCVTEKVRVSDNKPTGEFVTKIKLIEWQPEWARFQFKSANGNFELLPCTKQEWVSEWYEIIGNIYESFGLLEVI